MNMTIFKQELKMSWRSVVAWSVAVAALLFVYGSMFSSLAKDAELMNEMMAKFPPPLLTAFGMNGVDLSTVSGLLRLCLPVCPDLPGHPGRQLRLLPGLGRREGMDGRLSAGQAGGRAARS